LCQKSCGNRRFFFADAARKKLEQEWPAPDDGKGAAAYIVSGERTNEMAEDSKGINYARLAVGAGLLAVAAVSVAVFVPRRRLAFVTEPLAGIAKLPVAAAVTAWAMSLWHDATAPQAPVFDDLRPFDEF
jgi:hypothetical protein